MIKLIASDLDGTLLQNGAQQLTEQVIPYIKRLKEMGIVFVAASGRQYANLQRLFEPFKNEISYICENGALVVNEGKILHKTIINKELGEEILVDIRQKEGCEILLSGMNTSYLEPKTNEYAHRMQYIVKNNVTIVKDILEVTEDYLKISVYEREGINNSEEYFRDKWKDKVTVVTSGTEWLDMISLGTNKGNAMKVLQETFHILPEETMAFGDNYNDVEMLKNAGYSYAMNSGKKDIINLSRFSTNRVEDILAKVLNGEIK
ncbi:HAD family hydrolase [Lachnotalea glycerini]|uniref:HAD family hydrolase n=1 Tax=Lachnotalea glycerini TaxID=1763509 RepID=A0A371JKC2_9FIRM|nr:HAD family hydrolase [Lachnotalea glycerini]RDY33188.1 HAD family hydrolase [Lachnotalea glycerini]